VMSFSLAAMALLLTLVGVYGVIAYGVARRRAEIGIRMALGATAGAVRALVVAETLKLAAAGCALGLAASLGTAPVLQSLLFGVAPRDSVTLTFSALMLLVSSAVAGYVPARVAARLDPATALRAE